MRTREHGLAPEFLVFYEVYAKELLRAFADGGLRDRVTTPQA
jgi:hypothetical protein